MFLGFTFCSLNLAAFLHFVFDISRLALDDCATNHGHYDDYPSVGGAFNADYTYDP
jgi:hypothetical protein